MRTNFWLHHFAQFTAGCTLFLLFAGGMVTSTGSGLSVPDWPLSYGMLFPPMVGGVFYEHGHRMVAGFVGFLMVVECAWLWAREPRLWVKWVGTAAVLCVVAQGVLGGITVLFLLPPAVSTGHAGLAEIFFCLTVSLALFTSKEWVEEPPRDLKHSGNASFRRWSVATTLAIYAQILLGALMRHVGAGLAIPDFPLNFGRLVPPQFTPAIAVNFAHRLGAIVVVTLIVILGTKAVKQYRGQPKLVKPAVWMMILLGLQILLGAGTVWTRKAPTIATWHLTIGASILALATLLMLRVFRHLSVEPSAADESVLQEKATC